MALDRFESDFGQIAFDRGFLPDSGEVLQLTPPILGNESFVVIEDEPIYLESLLPGVAVRYTLDGSEPDSLKAVSTSHPFQRRESLASERRLSQMVGRVVRRQIFWYLSLVMGCIMCN